MTKERKVEPTERDANTASRWTGCFAKFCEVLHARERGAPSIILPWAYGRLILPAMSLALALLILESSPAAAAQSHGFTGSFGSPGTAAGQFAFTSESSLAVDQSTGDVYVANTGNHRVDEFQANGTFIRAFGANVGGSGVNVCTSSCLAGTPGEGAAQFEQPTFIAVDNTPGGSGDVYVADLGSQANERQMVTLNATGGNFNLSFTSTVYGDTTNGSKLVAAVVGRYQAGDPVSGPGIPAGTMITARLSETSFELSANATSTGRAALSVTETTASIAHNAPASHGEGAGSVEAALGALVTIGENGSGEGNARVSGSPGGPYSIEFVGVSNTNVAQMICDGSGLAPPGATCAVATAVEGKNSARIQKFDSAGNLITTWGGAPAGGELDGTTCPVESQCGFNPHFGRLEGVLVQPTGNLLVLSGSYSEWNRSSGEYVSSPGRFGNQEGPTGIAVDPAGHVYVGQTHGTTPPSFQVIQASLVASENAYQENFVVDAGPATGVAVDPSTEDAYVARYNPVSNHSDIAGYDFEGHHLETFGDNGEVTRSAGIAASGFSGSASDVYLADVAANRVEIFAPGGPRNSLTVTRSGSGLGSVTSEPAGIACPSTCSTAFPAGEVLTLTATAPEHSTFAGWSGGGCSGAGACEITLTADTSLTATFAHDRPSLTTAEASAITRHTATLTGTVNPEGDASSCRFEYGTTSTYGAEALCSTHPGSGASPVPISAQLWELAAGTIYHYRLVSANSGGASAGPDMTLTTLSEGCASNPALCPSLLGGPLLGSVALVLPEQAAPRRATRPLTNAQKLVQALKLCKKQKKKSTRVACEKRARKKYAPVKKKSRKSTRDRKKG